VCVGKPALTAEGRGGTAQSRTLTETVLRDTVLSALANEQHHDGCNGNKRKAPRTD
jgi:hypothetical protein